MYRISVDTGGTFTDVVVMDADQKVFASKALTSRERAYDSIAEGLTHIAAMIGISIEDLIRQSDKLNYGTTRATNLVVTGQTARTALLTTEGFPDVLLLREGGKPDPFRRLHYRPAFVPRFLTFEIDERVTSRGEIYRPLDEESVVSAIDRCRELDVEAIAISLLWSVSNPAHELRVGELVNELLPHVPWTLSHQINPTLREYRRASSTALDASLKPSMQSFFADLDGDLRDAGFTGSLLISTSYGGGWDADLIASKPVYSIGSGPSMAPVAALREAGQDSDRSVDENTILVTDMGGTTFDLSVVENASVARTTETWLHGKWIGDITGTRSVDVDSIGAGGGSIMWLDSGGLLHVGPQSAGSEPGPACYGRGGEQPTITDAALVLGYFDSSNFLGGRLELDRAAAESALRPVAERLEMSIEEAAWAAMRISVDNIVTAIRAKTVSRGIDTRDLTIVAGGGACGLNIGLIAEQLGVREVILPKLAGAMSALGALYSDVVSEFDLVSFSTTGDTDFSLDGPAVDTVSRQAAAFIESLPAAVRTETRIEYYVQARYPMQAWELTIPIGLEQEARECSPSQLEELFHIEHERIFGIRESDQRVEVLAVGTRAEARSGDLGASAEYVDLGTVVSAGNDTEAYFPGGRRPIRVCSASDLSDSEIAGPAIVREETTTLVVYPGHRLSRAKSGNYRLEFGPRKAGVK